jgi:ABC-type uncharacterized transport system substrate-binding protein
MMRQELNLLVFLTILVVSWCVTNKVEREISLPRYLSHPLAQPIYEEAIRHLSSAGTKIIPKILLFPSYSMDFFDLNSGNC